jgi:hypothetical protein
MTSAHPTPSEIAETRRKYLRWSIPSLVLAMVSLSFTVASHFVQQRVIVDYERVVSQYLAATKDAHYIWGEEDMRRAEIAAKRLVVEDPSSPQRILQSAEVGLASYEKIQNTIASQSDNQSIQVAKWMEMAFLAKARAIQSMQRVSKLEGAEALEARLWIQDWRFRSMRNRSNASDDRSSEFFKDCQDLISSGAPAHLLATDVLIHQALRFPKNAPWNETQSTIQRAREIFDDDRYPSLEGNASCVEIQSVLEPAMATVNAIKFVSESIRDSKQTALDWKGREAIFRLRLHMGNPAEAFDFAWTSLADLPAAEREIFRWNVAASSLRSMVVQLHQSDPQAKRNASSIFSFAVRFAPDSPQLVHVIRLLLENNIDGVGQEWLETMKAGHESGVSDWIDWVMSGTAKDAVASASTPRELPRLDPSFVPGAIVAIRVARQHALVEQNALTRMLDSLLEADPENSSLQRIREEFMNAKSETMSSAGESQKPESNESRRMHGP